MTRCTFMYNNLWDKAVVITPNSQDPLFPAINTQHRWLSKTWRTVVSSGTLTASCVIDLGSAQAVQAFILKGHNLSSSATIKIQGNASDVWTAPSVDVTLTLADLITYFWTAEQTYRYWRVIAVDSNPVTTYLEFNRTFLGPYFSPSVNLIDGYTKTYKDPSDIEFSDNGQISTNQKTKYRTIRMDFENIVALDEAEFDEMFLAVGSSLNLFWTLDRDQATTTTKYVRITGDPEITHVARDDIYNVSMSIEELR